MPLVKHFAIFLLLTCPLFFSSPIYAQTNEEAVEIIEIGRVLQVEGDAERKGLGEEASRRLIPGDAVFLYDTLATDVRSYVKIEFLDESQLAIQETSKIQLTRFVFSPAENKLAGLFTLVRGEIFAAMGKFLAQNSENSFEIETKNAVAGVRGTEFSVKTNDFTTEIYSVNHSTFIETRKGEFKTLSPREFLTISNEGNLGSITRFDEEKIRRRFVSHATPWRRPAHFERLAARHTRLAAGRSLPSPWIRTWQPGRFPMETPRWKLSPEERYQKIKERRENNGRGRENRQHHRHEGRQKRRGHRR